MKVYLSILTILIFALTVSGQKRRTPVRPIPTPSKPDISIEQDKEIQPTQKVSVEKNNGDRLTGLFVSGDPYRSTRQSPVNIRHSLRQAEHVVDDGVSDISV